MLSKGFLFSPGEVSDKRPVGLAPQCGLCGLHKKCLSPKMPASGSGKREILIVGEAPGENEDKQGRQFVGKTGQYLWQVLSRLGVDRQDCWVDNALMCRPKNNATPTDKQIAHCRPHLVSLIKELKPKVIILLGGAAVKGVLGWLWGSNVGSVGRWAGWQIPHQKLNAWVCPTFHPSYVVRGEEGEGKKSHKDNKPDPVREMLFEKHLAAAVGKRSRPWKEVPDYRSKVSVVVHPTQAVQYIQAVMKMGRPVAFDFETEGLKPDGGKIQIHSCAVSNGVVTASYPWLGKAVKETEKLIFSDFPKIAANMKFEERFCLQYLFGGAKNWVLDTVVAAHVLDNRAGVAGLKFQAFVQLGQEPYNDTVKPFLESREPGGYAKNRIREAPLDKLLLYGGLDALLEWEVAKKQARQLGKDIDFGGVEHAREVQNARLNQEAG